MSDIFEGIQKFSAFDALPIRSRGKMPWTLNACLEDQTQKNRHAASAYHLQTQTYLYMLP